MMQRFAPFFLLCLCIALRVFAAPIPDTPFTQEYCEKYPIDKKKESYNDVRAIAALPDGRIAAATKVGVFLLEHGDWFKVEGGPHGPAFCLHVDPAGTLWVGGWDGVYRLKDEELQQEDGTEDAAIAAIGVYEGKLLAFSPDGFFLRTGDTWERVEKPWSRSARDIARGSDGAYYIATHSGLAREVDGVTKLYTSDDELSSTVIRAVETAPDGRVWIGCQGGIDLYTGGKRVAHYGTEDGLPNYFVQCLKVGPDGRLWAGTELGVVRFDGKTWSLRHSQRWLPDDEVRDIAFDKEGNAWIATKKGVSVIKTRTMTLADKADFYLKALRERHVRPPGLVEKCELPDPDDLTYWKPVDDDNDGSFTAMYMAAECLRYAVTKDPEAKRYADEAWKAVAFLHEVTGGQGFVARSVVPSTWQNMHDGNHDISPEEAAEERVLNPRFKLVEKEWRRSDDAKWHWKGDTSSDETVGHFYAFNMYYHFAADEEQKEEVRALCRRFMDYIIAGDYTLIDPETGQHTVWGMWNPERLNHDPDWRIDAPTNSTEMLSFLRLTQTLTGDEKYGREFERLYNDYRFGERLVRPKSYGRAERTHIDDDLLSMVWPTYILNEKDPEVLARVKQGMAWTYSTIENDVNPYFNFIYTWAGLPDTHIDESIAFLRDTPLDLRQFAIDSSQREDVKVQRYPMLEVKQIDRILPPSERGTMRWDKNPWETMSGDFGDPKGHLESAGTYWLLPYWLGRYLNVIGPPEK